MKPLRTIIALLIFIFLVSSAGMSQNQGPTARDPRIENILRDISADNIKHIVDTLAGFGTRHTASDTQSPTRGIGAARRWIKEELEKYSKESGGRLKVEFDSFTSDPQTMDPHYRSRLPKPTELDNVVATLPGSNPDSAQRIYIVSGHYDSMCTQMNNTECNAPGADDDASGTAVAMELARVMSHYSFDSTLVFLCFAGEEQGLVGSKHWADMAKEKQWVIPAVLNNDIVGNIRGGDGQLNNQTVRVFSEGVPTNETPAEKRVRESIGAENDSSSRELARYIVQTAIKYIPDFQVQMIYRRDRYARGGDHSSFNDDGYAAIRFSEYHEDFHHQHQTPRVEGGIQYGDLPQFVYPDYIASVARVNAASLASLALAPSNPGHVRFGTARQAYDTVIQWEPNPEARLAGYNVVWRETTSPVWQHSLLLGKVTEVSLKGLSKDNLIFGIQAVDKEGNASMVVIPKPPPPTRPARTANTPSQ
ncbi:MAG: M28 family peptidase [Acidobacteriia bacterium]|nr:M28 family peptidase [Terriglobia bacterium]